VTARLTDYFAQRYGQLPSAILAEDARLMLRMRAILLAAEDEPTEAD